MYHFFVNDEQIGDRSVLITGSDVNHIKNVLRMKPGEELSVSNGTDGKEYRCGISKISDESIECEIRFVKEDSHELPCKVYLYQGLPKGDKFETVIQKNVELGVYEIIPVNMKRCVSKIDEKKVASKVSRWQGISEAASKQSKRGIIPKIGAPLGMKEAVTSAFECADRVFVPYELSEDMAHTRELFGSIKEGESIAVFIGPEGGFAPEEIDMLCRMGAECITLGKRILRTETAGMSVMSILMYLLEE